MAVLSCNHTKCVVVPEGFSINGPHFASSTCRFSCGERMIIQLLPLPENFVPGDYPETSMKG